MLFKAENEAVKIDHYSLLNEIYHTLIEYSHLSTTINQEELFRKIEVNNERFMNQERLNMVYAVVRSEFRNNDKISNQIDLEALLKSNYEKFGVSSKEGYSFQSLYQLAMISDIVGSQAKNYHAVDLFFIDKINELRGGEGDTEKMLIYHIDLLYSVANIYFRKKQFELSLNYLELMHEQMQRFNQKYHKEKFDKYTVLVALNLNFTNRYSDAESMLDELLTLSKPDSHLIAKLTRCMIHFQQGDLDKAASITSKLQRTDSWYEKTVGSEWLLNKRFIEIILHIELGDHDYVDSRIFSLVRKYGDTFRNDLTNPVLPFLKLIKVYFQNPEIATTKDFKELVETTIPWKSMEEEDIFFICFYAWLKSKMEQTPVYITTLNLINNQ